MDKGLKFFVNSVVLCFVFISVETYSYISVEPKVSKVFEEDINVKVINNGDVAEYLLVSLYRVNNPGVDVENESLTSIGDTINPSIVAVPFKLSLAPKQEKTIRIKSLRSVEKEEVYRLLVAPAISFSMKKDSTSLLVVNVAYNLLVRKLPSKLNTSWKFLCSENSVVLLPTGNSRIEVSREIKNPVTKININDFNLYPGDKKVFSENYFTGNINGQKASFKCY